MVIHPIVRASLNYYKSGVYGAEFWGGDDGTPQGKPICPEKPEVDDFVREQCRLFWDRGVPRLQGGYDYGWIGLENKYDASGGKLRWTDLIQFSPRDTFPLTVNRELIGVRVKNVEGKGQADLFTATRDVPAKGLWYAHDPRYNALYGQSQTLGAWRPWRRLAWKDGAETVADHGVYRLAFHGPLLRYPNEDLQTAQQGVSGTTYDSQGRPRRYARDMARQIAEQAKTGAGIGLPSENYSAEMGGGKKWDMEWPKHVLNVEPLIGYAKYLHDQIAYGIGVPPELLQAAETGSGYSGRAIPLEAFLQAQQRLANAILRLFIEQVLAPLVWWNFGEVRWHAEVKPLLQSKLDRQKGEKAQGQPAGLPGAQPPGTVPPGQEATGTQTPGPLTPQPTQAQQGRPIGLALHPDLVTDRIREVTRRILQAAA